MTLVVNGESHNYSAFLKRKNTVFLSNVWHGRCVIHLDTVSIAFINIATIVAQLINPIETFNSVYNLYLLLPLMNKLFAARLNVVSYSCNKKKNSEVEEAQK